MQQYYTLEQAAQILRMNPEQLKEMARKKEIRAFQDRSGWRFRAQEIDEMARTKGFGSDPELPLGEAAKVKPGDSGGNEVFNFSLGAEDSDVVPLGKEPPASDKGSRPGSSGARRTGSSKSPPPKASSDSDVRLVLEGGDVNLGDTGGSKPPSSKAPVSPPPKMGSSKSRTAPYVQDDSGVRIVPLDQPSDSDVKIVPASPQDSTVSTSGKSGKKSDSDIRIEEARRRDKGDQMVTEEIDLDAEQRKAEAASSKTSRQRPKPASSPVLPNTSPFELSEHDIDINRPKAPPAAAAGKAKSDTDSSSDFELKPMTHSSAPTEGSSGELPAIRSEEEINLGEMTGGKGASGISLQDPADSGISLEPESSSEVPVAPARGRAGKPTPAESGTDSSSDFELSVDSGEGSSPVESDSSSDFELSLQDDESSPKEGSSSEFELSLDSEGSDLAVEEGSSDLVLETPGSDSDSEFELTLDDSGGLSVEGEGESSSEENVLETDFDVPSLGEESGSDAVALDESDTGLESSEFDLSVEGEESGSQVVPLEDEEEYDEGAATVQRKAPRKPAAAAEAGLDDLGEQLDEDLDEEPAEEVAPAVVAVAPPAEWGVAVPVVSIFSTIILFLVMLMSFELMQGMWGYHTGNKVSNTLIYPLAKMFSGDDKLPDQ